MLFIPFILTVCISPFFIYQLVNLLDRFLWTPSNLDITKLNTNNPEFNYVLHKKNDIRTFIAYWLLYDYSEEPVNSKRLKDDDILPKDLKGNIITLNLTFNEDKLNHLIKIARQYTMVYNSKLVSSEYKTMLSKLTSQHKNFKVIDSHNIISSVATLLYGNSSPCWAVEYLCNIPIDLIQLMFPKNYRLSHISKFTSLHPHLIRNRYQLAVETFNLRTTLIKNLTNKMYFSKYGNHNVAIVNSGFWKSEIADYVLTHYKFVDSVLVWNYSQPEYHISIRTRPIESSQGSPNTISAQTLANLFGGGGNATVAGATTSGEWQKYFDKFVSYSEFKNMKEFSKLKQRKFAGVDVDKILNS